ncbi:sigma 54-interacting transcriptional regulator [Salicibibacter cibarius]|uniref:HTH-type transcriptional regulatory protein TyrR n=1 Tax=Salicibibacter cibarius TaxID=2743000 RepID=A0A7T6Z4B8_9BACI|nr:sigma 54-interacting transcriptional regulator [Salicibibacter cibarius]QQK76568.1 sigma 54-interacting transcriptional regulator [Salicibibacter cibarius]
MSYAEIERTRTVELPTAITDYKGKIVEYNEAFEEMVKRSDVGNLIDIEKKMNNPRNQSLHIECNHRLYRIIEQKCLNNKGYKIHIIYEDSELNELQKEIKNLIKINRELNYIIENSYDGISVQDEKGVTIRLNSSIERLTGIPREYFLGKSEEKLMTRGFLQESVTSKVLESKESVTVYQGGVDNKQIVMTGAPLFNEHNEIEKVIINIRDVTELVLPQEMKSEESDNHQKNRGTRQHGFICNDEKMIEIYNVIERVGNVEASVLITGETGVGKDIIARELFNKSDRQKMGQFVKINCGAIPTDLLESELFGYESGAFSGANRSGKPGLFELANKGMVFLDEIGELPLKLQVKLLQVIQDKEIRRIGATKTQDIDTRIIAATNSDLKEMVRNGEFREDLFYRLNVLPIHVPALRERKEDILPIAHFYLQTFNKKYNTNKWMSIGLQDFIKRHEWSGNIRELTNFIQRLVIIVPTNELSTSDLPEEYRPSFHLENKNRNLLNEAAEKAEKDLLQSAVSHYKTTHQIAEALNSSQATIARKLNKYNL